MIHSNLDGLFFQVLIAEEAEAEAGVGELCISSPAMFKEYWRKPEVSKSLHLSIWNSLHLFLAGLSSAYPGCIEVGDPQGGVEKHIPPLVVSESKDNSRSFSLCSCFVSAKGRVWS